jgi:hypothetical protein
MSGKFPSLANFVGVFVLFRRLLLFWLGLLFPGGIIVSGDMLVEALNDGVADVSGVIKELGLEKRTCDGTRVPFFGFFFTLFNFD